MTGKHAVIPTPKTARELAYEEIVGEAKLGLSRYYAEFPERIADDRSHDAVSWSTRGMARVLKILDRYDIQHLPNRAQERVP